MTFDSGRLTERRFRTYKFIFRFCRQERMAPERFWLLPFDRLRFSVGETLQNLKIPFAVARELRSAIESGLSDLRHAIGRREDDRRAPGNFRVEEVDSPTLAERVVRSSLALDPWLDPGTLRAWLGGGGGTFLTQVAATYRKAFLEERLLARTEPTTYLNQLAVLHCVRREWGRAREAPEAAAGWTMRAEIASACLLHALFDELVTASFENPVLVDSTAIDVRSEYLLKSSVSPMLFLGDPATVVAHEANPYGFGTALLDRTAVLLEGFDPMAEELEDRVESAARSLIGDAAAVREAVSRAWLAEVRAQALESLQVAAALPEELTRRLGTLATRPELLRDMLLGGTARAALVGSLRAARLEPLAERLAAADRLDDDPSRAFGRATSPEGLLRAALRSILVFRLDRSTREVVERSIGLLVDRKAQESTEVVANEYELGRVYRLAADDEPMLRQEVAREEAHLFIDLKDFTKRTHAVKEVRMADFLKEEFYGPLLALARESVRTGGPAALSLNNLLGDALSFSGEVKTLVELAERIGDLLGGYREKLRARLPEAVIRGEMARIDREYALEKARIAEKRAQLESVLHSLSEPAVGGAAPHERTGVFQVGSGLIGEANRAINALYRLEEEDRSLERDVQEREQFLVGADLVAGVFISFGAPATAVRLRDPAFGEVKVAIAEKINESARGTARNGEVKRRLDLLLRRAREDRKRPSLEYPFRVYIDKLWNVAVPPELTARFRAWLETRDRREATELFAELRDRVAASPAASPRRRGGAPPESIGVVHDLYNGGVALSEEALGAYQKATRERYGFYVKSVAVSELCPPIRERFFFDTPRLRLVFVLTPGVDRPRHVFRYAGSMTFRGFEQRTAIGIWEQLHPRDPFLGALLEHHVPTWLTSFRKSAELGGGEEGG